MTVAAAALPAGNRGGGASAGTTPLNFARGPGGAATAATWREISTFPIAVPMQMWWRDDRGHLYRAVADVETATPWWQRFPCDLLTDLTPWDQPIANRAHLHPLPLAPISSASLAAAAQENGYAGP